MSGLANFKMIHHYLLKFLSISVLKYFVVFVLMYSRCRSMCRGISNPSEFTAASAIACIVDCGIDAELLIIVRGVLFFFLYNDYHSGATCILQGCVFKTVSPVLKTNPVLYSARIYLDLPLPN